MRRVAGPVRRASLTWGTPGMTLPEMSLRFILSNPDVSTTIIGMRNLNHVKENFAASDAGPLDKALLAELKKHRWDRLPQPWAD